MNREDIISWLLEGDVSVQYQVHRDLLGEVRPDLQERIATEGWGKEFLARRGENGHWGRGFYQPKWTSTHYSLLDLRHLGISPDVQAIRDSVNIVFSECKSDDDGGINPHREISQSDVCINGMAMNYGCYFGVEQEQLKSVVDFVLSQKMEDGGFNCRSNRSGAVHSSLHTTISTIEGIHEYRKNGYTYRLDELNRVEWSSQEFILEHRLFKSDKTGEIIDKKMMMLSYPSRWKYDILRALDYFRDAGVPYDPRMDDAIAVIHGKQRKDGCWPVQAKHPGAVYFDMEKTGTASRWNTLRCMRVLEWFRE